MNIPIKKLSVQHKIQIFSKTLKTRAIEQVSYKSLGWSKISLYSVDSKNTPLENFPSSLNVLPSFISLSQPVLKIAFFWTPCICVCGYTFIKTCFHIFAVRSCTWRLAQGFLYKQKKFLMVSETRGGGFFQFKNYINTNAKCCSEKHNNFQKVRFLDFDRK